jgi:nucleoid-associated protein YgaU
MATRKINIKKAFPKRVESRVKVERPGKNSNILDRFQLDLNKERSYTNLVLGVLVVLVLGVLLFNFVSKQNFFGNNAGNLGPAQQTEANQTGQDVAADQLPGNYTVKEGDTLFQIAQKYYNDGLQYPKIVDANTLKSADTIEVGQVLQIPKLNQQVATAEVTPSPSATPAVTATPAPSASPDQAQAMNNQSNPDMGQGGAVNQTIWGEKIDGTTYTVQPGDWLSKIAGRSYGDIMQFNKIAKANHIADPNVIEPGTVLQIPR